MTREEYENLLKLDYWKAGDRGWVPVSRLL